MADFYGADTEQLREQAGACLRGSGTLRDLIGSTSALVGSVEWTGPDADAFRERWQSVVRAQLTERADALRARADDLQAQAEEQDGASDGDGGSGGGPFGFPMPFPFPLPLPLPLPFPVPGQTPPWENPGPFDRSNLPKGPQEFYGDPGYGTGNAAGNERPVGSHDAGGSHWDGKEIENDRGYFDGYANTRASAGTNTTVDGYGNTTHTAGARAGAEIGYDEKLNLPFGSSLTSQGRAGAEAYGEAGVTYGPDGVSAGAGAGAGVYGDITDTLNLPFGASESVGMSGYAGAEAHANAYSHATRNEDGDVNGWTLGADAGAFAGAKGDINVSATSPGGWASASASFGAEAGVSIGGGAGAVVSTDQVGFSVGGDIAEGLGLEGDLAFSVSPNNIMNTFTPEDYDVDDAIDDAQGAFDSASSAVGDAVDSITPW